METKLKHLQRYHTDTLDMRVKQEIKEIRNEIDEIGTQEIQKKLLFTKQRYYEIGGQLLKLLSYKLRRQQADHAICKIRDPESGKIHGRKKSFLSSQRKGKIIWTGAATIPSVS